MGRRLAAPRPPGPDDIWADAVEVMMLILYERADYTAAGLRDFLELVKDYINAYQCNAPAVLKLEKEFSEATGLYLSEAFSESPEKNLRVMAVKAGALALWSEAGWDKKNIRQFVYAYWDMIGCRENLEIRVKRMLKRTKIEIRVR